MRRFATLLTTALTASLLMTGPALAKDKKSKAKPYTQPDGSWISLSGTAVQTADEAFTLDYGPGIITVEVDDWDRYPEARVLLDGDEVTVFGQIDDDLFEVASIEASSVYVKDLNTWFHANPADEESASLITYDPVTVGHTLVWGTVESVDEEDRTFTVDTGVEDVTVDTATLAYNPLDDLGWQKIDTGDLVRVSGAVDRDFFDGRTLDAHVVTTVDFADNGETTIR